MAGLIAYMEERERRRRRQMRKVQAAVQGWIRDQNATVLAQLELEQIIQPEQVLAGYDFDAALKELQAAIREPLILAGMSEGQAVYDQNAATWHRTKGLGSILTSIENSIESVVDEVLGEPYWEEVVRSLQRWATSWLHRAIAKPEEVLGVTLTTETTTAASAIETTSKISEGIKKKLPKVLDDLGKHRAEVIAETETQGVMNGGGNEAGKQLAAVGDVEQKTWITMVDERVRTSHKVLHLVSVEEDANFDVGGSPAPHPGWWRLPTQHRIGCRCWVWHGPIDPAEINELVAELDPELKATIDASHPSGEPTA